VISAFATADGLQLCHLPAKPLLQYHVGSILKITERTHHDAFDFCRLSGRLPICKAITPSFPNLGKNAARPAPPDTEPKQGNISTI